MSQGRYAVAVRAAPAFAHHAGTRSLAALARRVLVYEGAPPGALSIVVADDTTVRDLNRRFRAVDAATDVLSFGLAGEDGFVTPEGAASQLGEVVISYPTAARQAAEAGRAAAEELAHLLVHGVLHLLGYDHQTQQDERRMRAREEELLGRAVH